MSKSFSGFLTSTDSQLTLQPSSREEIPQPRSHDPREEEVCISSLSTIYFGEFGPRTYDRTYLNVSGVYKVPGIPDSPKLRSVYYEGDKLEFQEVSFWMEGESDSDASNSTNPDHHYEAVYEVINPDNDDRKSINNEFDDFFDSVGPGDQCSVPHKEDDALESSPDRPESVSFEVSRDGEDKSQNHYGITKFAEVAGQKMRKLRHNWYLTKNDMIKGLNRLRKQSTRIPLEGLEREGEFNSVQLAEKTANCVTSNTKHQWSFRSHFRRKTNGSGMGSSNGRLTVTANRKLNRNISAGGNKTSSPKKETATFYIMLTIEADKEGQNQELPDTQNRSSDQDSPCSSANTDERKEFTVDKETAITNDANMVKESIAAAIQQRSSYAHNRMEPLRVRTYLGSVGRKPSFTGSYGPIRPKTAPPAPPNKQLKDANSEATALQDNKCKQIPENELIFYSNSYVSHSQNGKLLRSVNQSYLEKLNQIIAGEVHNISKRKLPLDIENVYKCEKLCSTTSVQPSGWKNKENPTSVRILPLPVGIHYSQIGVNKLVHSKENHYNPQNTVNEREDNLFQKSNKLSEKVIDSLQSSLPKLQTSIANSVSQCSSDGYISAKDIASSPVLKSNDSEAAIMRKGEIEMKSYLDLKTIPEQGYRSSHFDDEPLYQFYTESVIQRAANHNAGYSGSEDSDYEVIDNKCLQVREPEQENASHPTAMEIVTPNDGHRTLWCELPEVCSSGILDMITAQQRKLQEAMFEVITSEASYMKSLNILVNHFIQCPQFLDDTLPDHILSKRKWKILFSDVLPVKHCSEMFLADLERRWQKSLLIQDICDIVYDHASRNFGVYIRYCSNQIYQDRTLRDLKENNTPFVEVLHQLESNPVCQSLAMHSFLMLPMQRITRLPLLIDAIFSQLDIDSPQYKMCKITLATLNNIVHECNEGARKMERMEEMLIISQQLDFREVKPVPLISASRWLVKKGELTRLTWKENDAKLTFGRRISKQALYLFLFTDVLVMTKRKSEDSYTVLDYCPRNMIQVSELQEMDKLPVKSSSEGIRNMILLTMLQNHENKTLEMVLSCPLESDRARWIEAVTPKTSENPNEIIYEEWDCPQVQVIHPYIAQQPDELSLNISDVVNVLKKVADGWFQGEKICDGQRGWFPQNYTREIVSAHVKARNLRQRHRLLALSGLFVEQQRKKREQRRKEVQKQEKEKKKSGACTEEME